MLAAVIRFWRALSNTAPAADSVAVGSNASVTSAGKNSVALGAGSIAGAPNTVSVGAPGAERRITNVAPGINGTDAANVDQVNAVAGLANQIGKRAYAGTALALATQAQAPYIPGKFSMGVGYGFYANQHAVAVHASYWSQDGKWNINGAVGSGFTKQSFGARVGVDFVF